MSLELPLTLAAGHRGTMFAAAGNLGWDVRIDVDGVTVLRSHASDWHRVERLRARVEATHRVAPDEARAQVITAGASRRP